MKTFDEIYEELQNANNNELNYVWQGAKEESKKTDKIAVAVCVLIDILLIKMNFDSLFLLIYKIIIVDLCIFVLVKWLFRKNKNKFNVKYKEIVINRLMSNFYNSLEYFPNKPMPKYIY